MKKSKEADVLVDISFEEGVSRLDGLIQQLESGHLPLDEAVSFYRQGAELLQECQKKLSVAEAQIKVLEDDILHAFTVKDVVDGRAILSGGNKKDERST